MHCIHVHSLGSCIIPGGRLGQLIAIAFKKKRVLSYRPAGTEFKTATDTNNCCI